MMLKFCGVIIVFSDKTSLSKHETHMCKKAGFVHLIQSHSKVDSCIYCVKNA